ncbi:MAG: ComEC/Rec2 family competence protein [Bacteroidales bacterium]|nr:ComEC/Rec2 family competence protein [Bacteroidales bacterium]
MWQGRELILCTLALWAGNWLGDVLSFPPLVYLLLALFFAVMSALHQPRRYLLLACFALLGAAAVQLGRMPFPHGPSSLALWAADRKTAFSAWLGGLLPPGEEGAVLRALAIGDRAWLSRDLRSAWRQSGALHLLALSGLHVGLIYALLSRLLAILGGSRPARFLRSTVILGLLWTYALITGLGASIVRAVLMITFYEFSGFFSGDRDSLVALFGSAFLLMVFRPEAPRDIGFQLSYTAVLSILLLHPRLKTLLQTRFRLLARVWEMLSISLCCQATCGVLAWLYFGTFPRYFLLTTLLAIPLTTIVMYGVAAGVAARLLASALPSLTSVSDIVLQTLGWLLRLLNSIIHLIAGL